MDESVRPTRGENKYWFLYTTEVSLSGGTHSLHDGLYKKELEK